MRRLQFVASDRPPELEVISKSLGEWEGALICVNRKHGSGKSVFAF